MNNEQPLQFNNILPTTLTPSYENEVLNEESEPEDSILKEIYNRQTFTTFEVSYQKLFN